MDRSKLFPFSPLLFPLISCFIFLLIGNNIYAANKPFIYPASGVISSPFGGRYGRFHNGIDIAPLKLTFKARIIRASGGGIVIYAGKKKGFGNLIVISHGALKTYYAHNAKLFVKKGQEVFQGQRIAKMGSSGRSTNIHLHFEIRKNGKPVNPELYLK